MAEQAQNFTPEAVGSDPFGYGDMLYGGESGRQAPETSPHARHVEEVGAEVASTASPAAHAIESAA